MWPNHSQAPRLLSHVPFVLFRIVLYVLLFVFPASDYPSGIFKLYSKPFFICIEYKEIQIWLHKTNYREKYKELQIQILKAN
jgi:hypothetical protein